MKITLKQKPDTNRVIIGVRRSLKKFRRGVRNALFEIGRESVQHTRGLILDENKNGRFYHIKGAIHQASAPGEAPATLTGTLQKSVKYNVRGSSEVEFGDKVYYGKYLEEGTKKMAARPHLAQTVSDRQQNVRLALERHVDRELKKK